MVKIFKLKLDPLITRVKTLMNEYFLFRKKSQIENLTELVGWLSVLFF